MDINNNSAQKIGLDYILERGVADYSDGDIVIFEHLGGKSVDGSVKLDMIMMVYCVVCSATSTERHTPPRLAR